MPVDTLILVIDLVGTFVFALSGAAAGLKHRLDLFGVLVLSYVAATAGGVARDLLIGAVPPLAISDLRYMIVPVLAGLMMFRLPGVVRRYRHIVALFDAAGLALFAVSGAQKALAFGLNPVAAAMLGMLTGIGGGIARDLLVNEIPAVLSRELYAVAALAGAAVVVAGDWLRLPSAPVATAAALLCFGLRIVAIRERWHLPVAEPAAARPAGGDSARPNQADK